MARCVSIRPVTANTSAGDRAWARIRPATAMSTFGGTALFLNVSGRHDTELGLGLRRASHNERKRERDRISEQGLHWLPRRGPVLRRNWPTPPPSGPNALVNDSNALGARWHRRERGAVPESARRRPRACPDRADPSTSYGSYLKCRWSRQCPPPPAADCNVTTFVGRLSSSSNDKKVRATLWSCSAAGVVRRSWRRDRAAGPGSHTTQEFRPVSHIAGNATAISRGATRPRLGYAARTTRPEESARGGSRTTAVVASP